MLTEEPLVFVLLPVHNRKALTLQFVRTLRNQSFLHLQLILIDDGSTDETAVAVRAIVPECDIIHGDGDLWWAGSLNQAFRWLINIEVDDRSVVMIANDDTVLEDDTIKNAVRFLDSRHRTLLLAQHRISNNAEPIETGTHFDIHKWRDRPANMKAEINCLATRCLFLRWGDIMEIGWFRPRLLPHYFSDYEFTMRAYRKGFTLTTTPEVAISANLTTTGFHQFGRLDTIRELRRLFSKKSSANPFYASIFAFMVSPFPYCFINVWRVWYQGIIRAFKLR